MRWQTHAACADMDKRLFFPDHPGIPSPVADACAKCPVRTECDTYANQNDVQGIWAGTHRTNRQQKAQKQRNQAA